MPLTLLKDCFLHNMQATNEYISCKRGSNNDKIANKNIIDLNSNNLIPNPSDGKISIDTIDDTE